MKTNKSRQQHPLNLREAARTMRQAGMTHREIASQLAVAVGTAHLWTKDISISAAQRSAILERKHQRAPMSNDERAEIKRRLAPYQFKPKHSAGSLIARIRDFYAKNGRIPLKREFNAWHAYARCFGSWNRAVRAAGFSENPELFARKFTAKDGHRCDSFSETLIDDWLHVLGIPHERSVPYPDTRYTADFKVKGTYIEFFGLAGVQAAYDMRIAKKRALAAQLGCELIELYPSDLYPANQLDARLASLK